MILGNYFPSDNYGFALADYVFRFTFPQVPRAVSDAIYGRVRGAQYDEKDQLWLVPCDQQLNISFNFGGVNFPIHPLDTVSSDFNMTDASGNAICVGVVSDLNTLAISFAY